MFLLQIMCFSVQTAPCLHGKDRQSSIHLQKPIAPAAGGIEQVNIMSHTAKVTDNSQINPQIIRKDRILSAMRSAEVCIYLQQQNVIKPEKLVDISYGEYLPYSR